MKIYTRTGDEGKTGLIGGGRVAKTDLRMRACGEIDELNALLGWARVAADPAIAARLATIQSDLFFIGAALATPLDKAPAAAALSASAVARLEGEIDLAEAQLAPLRSFILPGGGESAARLHLGRSVCRRAERQVIELHQQHPADAILLQYINRLSDWLFVHARLANHLGEVEDVVWKP
jgi:cob(I)alamin adenosyltransferase